MSRRDPIRSPRLAPWAGLLSFLVAAVAAPPAAGGQEAGTRRAVTAEGAAGELGPERGSAGRWTVDDLLLQETAGGFRFSPDGEWLAWVRSAMDPTEGRRDSDLWLTRVADGESWQLTRSADRDWSPRWSPDGTRIAFMSDRELPGAGEGEAGQGGDSGPQVWMLRLRGGEPWPATRDLRGIRDVAWQGTRDSLVVAARERRSRYEREMDRREDDARVVEDTLSELPVRLWRVPGGDGEPERITRNDDWIQSVAVSPSGDRAVVVAGRDLSHGFDGLHPPHTYLVDLATGERERLLEGEDVRPYSVQWARDGGGVYLSYPYSTHPVYVTASVTRMGFYDLSGGGEGRGFRRVDLDWRRELGAGFQVVPGGFVALLADGVHYRPARYERTGDGWRRTSLEGEHVPHIYEWRVAPDGRRVAYRTSTAELPPRPYVAGLEDGRIQGARSLATLDPALRERPMPRAEIVRWAGARGDTVEGILYHPLDGETGRARPLILNIHGGPASQDMDRWTQSWSDPLVLFLQRGAYVLQVNYHGSGNYGLQWVESIGEGRYYDLEVPDIEAGVDRLVDRGLVHPDSVATQGWSNGAILSNALTVENPDRYRASLAGAGDVEWISDWGNIDFGATFDNYYFGGPPYEIPEVYVRKSPFFELDEVTTPTLIFFGTEDRNVPTSQGWSHFRALQQIGEAPVRFVLFPGEAHGLDRLAHQRRKVAEELAWLDRHLWGRRVAEDLSLDGSSPLARELGLAGAARTDGRYGRRTAGTLVPETVPAEGLEPGVEVGRFEVTRAQWEAFDPDHRVPPGTGDHPASGMGREGAEAYLRWLSERTGEAYRLPTREELEALSERAPEGNTLDHWAGYPPNPSDAARLRELSRRLDRGEAPLLLPVGSFPGAPAVRAVADWPPEEEPSAGTGRIYGLAGGVAEWVRPAPGGEPGGGAPEAVPYGPSADRPREAETATDDPAYVGLRVMRVREEGRAGASTAETGDRDLQRPRDGADLDR